MNSVKQSAHLRPGQSWEIDEPGYVYGDIYDNLLSGILDNTNGVPVGFEDDVSMAMAWDFILGVNQEAVIEFVLSSSSTSSAPSGFYLAQTDPDSSETIYFSSTLEISQPGFVIPEPSTMILFGVGLLAFARTGRRQK